MNKLLFIISIFLISSSVYSQEPTKKGQEVFSYENQARYAALTTALKDLPINSCIINQLNVRIEIDSTGLTTGSKLGKPTYSVELDSLIIKTINNFEGKWYPMKTNGVAVNTSMGFSFLLLKIHKTNLNSKSSTSTYTTITHGARYSYTKNCEDSEYFFNNGIKWYNAEKYKYARNDFLKSLKSNPNDLNARYNLALCYLQLKKPELACLNFKMCAAYNHEGAIIQLNKTCGK
jgi:tetratricopeptide (TPR) repeat protein